ncbi:hypothetical protein QQS21_004645 [Conoideocrella luteorostrata]|uniref:Uncharacterized protein n=1 Tax=Conoideocrella luteorostrata TaxID=1105319 RepID=A0AAJ0CTT2_9HYPO|nr:hypothetical protein QQS21_004645 [Conoideocrella luteorostrata]
MGWTMRFNDVLDANMLHESFKKLLEIGDWRKLSGRLRRNDKGHLEIRVPKQFTPDMPAVEYKHDTAMSNESINCHPIGKDFPEPTDQPSIRPLPEKLRCFMAPDDFPATVDVLVQSDKSQVALTITSFTDATLVSIALPHTLGDIVSLVQLIQNWSRVLCGRASDVPPLLDAFVDVLEPLEDDEILPREDFLLESKQLGSFGLAKFMARQLLEKTQRNRQLQSLYIPKDKYQALLSKVRAEAQEIAAKQDDSTSTKKPDRPLNEIDIITSWFIRIISSQEATPRPVTIFTLYNMRFLIKSLMQMQAKGVFTQTMVSGSCAMFSGEEATSGSVSEIAKSYRAQVAKQTTEGQVLANLRRVRRELKTGNLKFAMYGETDSLLIYSNPLAKLGLVKMANFAPAVIATAPPHTTEKSTIRSNPPGTMVSNVFNPLNWADMGLDGLFPLGNDHAGGSWIMAKMSAGSWNAVIEELDKL